MKNHPPRNRMIIAYIALYFAYAAATARAFFELHQDPGLPYLIGFLVFYLLLLLVEPYLISRNLVYLHLINGLQTIITLVLLIFIGNVDYFSLLFIPPCTQSILNFPRRVALFWIGMITLLMIVAQFISFPLSESIGYVIIYPTAIFLFSALSYLAKQAQDSQDRSERLLSDLQVANQKLQAYATQVEELAATNERNRLARELHDSVTQIIFGLTLSAQAARILIDKNPTRAASELDHLQELAQNALTEMRALVQELHPHSAAEEGLVPALNRMVKERLINENLSVDLQIKGGRRLPAKIEGELFRIVQEALNNIVKHAQTNKAVVTLDLGIPDRIVLEIEDAGVGFDPVEAKSRPGHLGLISMEERVRNLGGALIIDSRSGKGTRLRVEISLDQEA